MKVGGQILWNVILICETSQIYCLTGRRPMKDVLGNHPRDRFPLGAMVEFLPFTVKDQSRIHQFGKKVLLGLFLGYTLHACGLWRSDVLVGDLQELEDDGRIGNLLEKTQCERGDISHRKGRIYFPIAD